jgi:hypothetical protein
LFSPCIWFETMSSTAVVYKKRKLLTLREHLGSAKVLCVIRVAHLFSFQCCVHCLFFFKLCLLYPMLCSLFIFLLAVSFIPNVVFTVYFSLSCVFYTQCCIPELSIFDYHLRFFSNAYPALNNNYESFNK